MKGDCVSAKPIRGTWLRTSEVSAVIVEIKPLSPGAPVQVSRSSRSSLVQCDDDKHHHNME